MASISIADRILALQQWQSDKLSSLMKSVSSGSSSTASSSDIFSAGDYGQSQVIEAFAQKRELYTAQLSELGKYKSAISGLTEKSEKIANLDSDSSAEQIKSAAKQFISDYNAFMKQFEGDFSKGGLLKSIDNANISRFEIVREADNVFNGSAKLGFGGLQNAGITQDPDTGLLSMDEKKFDSVLASNKEGVVSGLKDLGAHMVSTTKMLVADDKFLAHSQAKYSEALTWIEANDPGKSSSASSALSLYSSVATMKG